MSQIYTAYHVRQTQEEKNKTNQFDLSDIFAKRKKKKNNNFKIDFF